jgi:hypothetical protein
LTWRILRDHCIGGVVGRTHFSCRRHFDAVLIEPDAGGSVGLPNQRRHDRGPGTGADPHAYGALASRLRPCRRLLLHDAPGRNFFIRTLIVVDPYAEAERSCHARGVVNRPAGQCRHFHFARPQRDAHGETKENEECQAEGADEEEELSDTPDASAEAH